MVNSIERSNRDLQRFEFEGIVNFRDLGGLKGADNGMILPGRIFRSATFDFATKKDYEKLKAMEIDLFIDFRMPTESKAANSKRQMFSQHFNRLPQPINVGDFFSPERVARLREINAEEAREIFIEMYRAFPFRYPSIFQRVFQELMTQERVVYHCSAGKDRTGITSFLVLSALGVHRDDILNNFLESNEHAEALHNLFRAARPKEERIDPQLEAFYKKIRTVDEAYLLAAEREINAAFGNIERYLIQELGVDVEAFRRRYLC